MTRPLLLAAALAALLAAPAAAQTQTSPLLEANSDRACPVDAGAAVLPVDALVDSAWLADAVRDGFRLRTGHAAAVLRWDTLGRPLPVTWLETTVGPDPSAAARLAAAVGDRMRERPPVWEEVATPDGPERRRVEEGHLLRVDVGTRPQLRTAASEVCAPELRGGIPRGALRTASRALREHLPRSADTVTVHVLVDSAGQPARLEVRSAAHPAALRAGAIDLVRALRWRPGRVNRVAAPLWVTVPVPFYHDET